ncbi:MAG TPA: hypothetical protein PLD20_05680 [Blastocatellia bacterium]|nr:hypothetical protein [Blastocatellia bacterium]HMX25678.1 hypothetical protein [Blastocatellia bacterium]HMZ17397.1 hypothetical protein [Blastocatellia bacterium]HNG29231.1 hypothetical protein [Blastocatellia bacterium]
MTETSAIIPVNQPLNGQDAERMRALITMKQGFGKAQLAQMSLEELRSLQQEWYFRAAQNNVLMLLQVLICMAGKADFDNSRHTWTEGNIEAIYEAAGNSLVIRVAGALVCDNRNPGQEIFVPGEWLKTAIRTLDHVELQRKHRNEAQERAARHDLISLLGAEV